METKVIVFTPDYFPRLDKLLKEMLVNEPE